MACVTTWVHSGMCNHLGSQWHVSPPGFTVLYVTIWVQCHHWGPKCYVSLSGFTVSSLSCVTTWVHSSMCHHLGSMCHHLGHHLVVMIDSNPFLEKIITHSLQGFAYYLKTYILQRYHYACTISDCYVCQISLQNH